MICKPCYTVTGGVLRKSFHWLPRVRPEQREALDRPLSLQELVSVVQHLSWGHTHTIDGIPAEFLRSIWGAVGEDLVEVFLQSLCESHQASVSRQWCHLKQRLQIRFCACIIQSLPYNTYFDITLPLLTLQIRHLVQWPLASSYDALLLS